MAIADILKLDYNTEELGVTSLHLGIVPAEVLKGAGSDSRFADQLETTQ